MHRRNAHLNYDATIMLLNNGVVPKMKLTINSFPWQDFTPDIFFQLSNSLTFPGRQIQVTLCYMMYND